MFINEVYKDLEAPAIALLIVFISVFGAEALEWDPEVIRSEIDKTYSMSLNDMQLDKLNAAIEILTSDLFETNWNVFETCSHLLSNVAVDPFIVSILTPEEAVKSLAESYLIRHDTIKFNGDINVYLGKIFHDFGMSSPPELFPDVIMPNGNKSDDKDKNTALKELFDYHINKAISYVEKIET
jgi:hypothetical protein